MKPNWLKSTVKKHIFRFIYYICGYIDRNGIDWVNLSFWPPMHYFIGLGWKCYISKWKNAPWKVSLLFNPFQAVWGRASYSIELHYHMVIALGLCPWSQRLFNLITSCHFKIAPPKVVRFVGWIDIEIYQVINWQRVNRLDAHSFLKTSFSKIQKL